MSYVIVPDLMYFKLNEFSDLTLHLKSLDDKKTYATYKVHKVYLAKLSPMFHEALQDDMKNEIDLIIPEALVHNWQEIIEFLYSPGQKKVGPTTKQLMQSNFPKLKFSDDQVDAIQNMEDKHFEALNAQREQNMWHERSMQQASPLLSVQGSQPRVLPGF